MPKLLYSPHSRDDIKYLASYIARDKISAAIRWENKVRAKCRLVSKHPELGDSRAELGEGIRSVYLGRYVIYFRQIDNVVEIIRVIPGDRDVRSL